MQTTHLTNCGLIVEKHNRLVTFQLFHESGNFSCKENDVKAIKWRDGFFTKEIDQIDTKDGYVFKIHPHISAIYQRT